MTEGAPLAALFASVLVPYHACGVWRIDPLKRKTLDNYKQDGSMATDFTPMETKYPS